MKLFTIFMLGAMVATVANMALIGVYQTKTTLEEKEFPVLLEVSVNGEVHAYDLPTGSYVHVVADQEGKLTDIQFQTSPEVKVLAYGE